MIRIIQACILVAACSACAVAPTSYGPWGDPRPVLSINTPEFVEGCPIESPDGLSLWIASNRAGPGAQGKLDVHRARRASVSSGWGPTENPGAPVNSTEFDYCPTPLPNGQLMLVSSRVAADDCFPGETAPAAAPGGPAAGDMYRTQERAGAWTALVNLGCYPAGPNTAGAEFSPSMVKTAGGTFLYFSSNGYPDSQGQDIYVSRVREDGTVLAGTRVAELSTASDDRMPNVREDGLEIVFSSNRGGATPFDQDIYVATRVSTSAPWSAPTRIANTAINSPASETRASLSSDGQRLYFGRKLSVEDPGDIFVSTRSAQRN